MKRITLLIASLLIGATFVAAALVLLREEKVETCNDSDNGLNFVTAGVLYGVKLNGAPFAFPDGCSVDGLQLYEWACKTVSNNVTGDQVYGQLWLKDCTDLGLICISGRCV